MSKEKTVTLEEALTESNTRHRPKQAVSTKPVFNGADFD
jgi:hypothetical protein